MRSYDVNDGFEAMRRDLLYTRSVLVASGAHEPLVRTVDRVLQDWEALAAARRTADDAATLSRARAVWAARWRDELLLGLAAQVGLSAPPSELAGPEARATVFDAVRALADTPGAPDAAVALQAKLEAAMGSVDAAITARDEAEMACTRLTLRLHAWRDAANAARRSVHERLQAHARAEHLATTYADGFFTAELRGPRRGDRATPLVLAG